MTIEQLFLKADEIKTLRAALSLARMRWRHALENFETDPWTHFSLESMRLSADLYRIEGDGSVEITTQTVRCLDAVLVACANSPQGLGEDLAKSLARIVRKVRAALRLQEQGEDTTERRMLRLTSEEGVLLSAGLAAANVTWSTSTYRRFDNCMLDCAAETMQIIQDLDRTDPAEGLAELPVHRGMSRCIRNAASECTRFENDGIRSLEPRLHDVANLVDALFASLTFSPALIEPADASRVPSVQH